MAWITGDGAQEGKTGQPCSDVVGVLHIAEKDMVIAALADGAGTALYGGVGAQVAVGAALAFMQALCNHDLVLNAAHYEDLLIALLTSVRTAIRKHARTHHPVSAFEDFATTFLLVIATDQSFAALQVGDGFILRQDSDLSLHLCTQAPLREYVNQSHFLTDDTLHPQMVFWPHRVDFWSLSSDGLESVAIDHALQRPHPGFWAPFQSYLQAAPSGLALCQEIKSFLASPPLSKKVKDDRSLIIGGWQSP